MSACRLALLIVLLGCLLPGAEAQQYRLYARRYSVEEGLPHRQVNAIMQDRRGFIWAATNAGVVRFDGRRFKTFNKIDNGLSGDVVDWVAEDAAGYIWACRLGANPWLDILDPLSGKITPAAVFFKDRPLPVSIKRLELAPIIQQDSTLVFGLNNPGGWLTYHPRKGWHEVSMPGSDVFRVIKSSQSSNIWGVRGAASPTQNGLFKFDAEGRILHQYLSEAGHLILTLDASNKPDEFSVLEISSVPTPKSTCWKVMDDGAMTACPSWNELLLYSQRAELENGQIRVQFPFIYDQNGQCLLDLKQYYPEIDITQYRDYLVDRNGQIWFATTFGLIVVDCRKDLFRRLLYDPHAPGGRGYACRGLLEQNGQLTINIETRFKGRFLVNPQTGTYRRIEGDNGMGIAKSADGNIWSDFEVKRSDWNTSSLMKTSPDGKAIGPHLFQKRDFGAIWTILEENPSRVLLGHNSGITVFNPETGMAMSLPLEAEYPEFSGAIINHIGNDRKGRIWACTDQGLYQLTSNGGVLARYWTGGKAAFHLPYDNLLHFYDDDRGVFWIGTSGGGLIRWSGQDMETREVQLINRKNGLLNGVVYGVYEDQHQHLWMPTDYGIVQFDKQTLQVRRTWLETDGLSNNEFNRISHCRGADGTLYFGGLNGVTAFQPNDFYASIEQGARGKQLLVSDYQVFDKDETLPENRTAELLQSSRITMLPSHRYVQLEFALLDFFAPEKATYTWKIEGMDKDWETLREPVLRLSTLPYGDFKLRIRAQSADGLMAGNELAFQLTVLPPFYLRWWFLLLVAATLAAAIYAWLHWRIRNHRQEEIRLKKEVLRQTATILDQTEKLRRLDEAKSRFFANISHELRTPLTLLLGPISSMIKRNRLDDSDERFAKTAQQHGRQLLQLVNEILDLSKMESGKMTLHETAFSLYPFLRRVTSAFESHAERLGILFVFEYQVNKRIRILADADKLQKIVNNFLSNALKFTPAHANGSVRVRTEMEENKIRISVQDSGRGIHPNDLPHVFERFYQTTQSNAPIEGGTGIGLAICREFAELLQGRVWVESTPGRGSSFYFEFPLKEVLGAGPLEEDPRESDWVASRIMPLSEPLAPPEEAPADAPLLFLVEDNDSMRDYISSLLQPKYQVVQAENGQMALDLLSDYAANLPQLIISDIMMPVMDGFQLLENLKNDERWRHIPVVMLTARADIDDKLRALRIGVDDYLSKPFEEDELLARVENLIRQFQGRAVLPEDEDPAEQPLAPTFSAADLRWLEAFEQLVEKELGNFNLTAEMLAEKMLMSRSPFFRQLKRLTGLTPAQYLDEARFQKARRMFERREASSVKSVAYAVGFKQVKHFSQNYKKRFGKLPSEYAA